MFEEMTGNPIKLATQQNWKSRPKFSLWKNCHFMCIITLLSLKFILLIFWIILMIEVTLQKWGGLGQMLGGLSLRGHFVFFQN